MNEVDIDSEALDTEVLQLNKPSEYYYELYKQVRETARQQKQSALENYMKAKNIKNTYMLDDISDTSDDIQNIGSDIEEEMKYPKINSKMEQLYELRKFQHEMSKLDISTTILTFKIGVF